MPPYGWPAMLSDMAAQRPDPLRLIPYGGDNLRVLGECHGLAFCELAVPPRFAGPPPHIHNGFDEAIYVLRGELMVTRGHENPRPAGAETLFLAPRGTRHTFANHTDEPVHVLGIWSPGSALTFMKDIGAALPPVGPADPEVLGEIYRRHHSEIDL